MNLVEMADARAKALAEYAEAKKKRGPGLTSDEASAGTRVDMRTAAAVAAPTPHQIQRHGHLYGQGELGRCKALYEQLSARGISTPVQGS